MIKSMTGFGKSECVCGNRKIRVEIKSLNSKTADISVKLPGTYRDREMELRNEVVQSLVRGKIDVYVSIDADSSETEVEIQPQIAEAYYRQVQALAARIGVPVPEDILSALLRFPDVMANHTADEEPCPWDELIGCVRQALTGMDEFRVQEGQTLSGDLKARVETIIQNLGKVENLDSRRMESVKLRIRQHLDELGAAVTIDKNRFEQELIYYLEKIDITEEKVRLGNHCAYFLDTLLNEETAGRKLGFISQEMGREINTMGSKANDVEVQQIVVVMKDELEKIKEQLLNIL